MRFPSSTPTNVLRLDQTTYTDYFYCLLSAILDELICVWVFLLTFFFLKRTIDGLHDFFCVLCSTDDADRAGAIASLYLSGIYPQPKALPMYSLSAKVILQA